MELRSFAVRQNYPVNIGLLADPPIVRFERSRL